MKELDLIHLWVKARNHIIISQFAPTVLLIFALLMTPNFVQSNFILKVAYALVLLSSGILGAVAQISSANEASAIAAQLALLEKPALISQRIIATAPWIAIVKFGTPAIFTLTFITLLIPQFAIALLG
jgi:hypothetical protein